LGGLDFCYGEKAQRTTEREIRTTTDEKEIIILDIQDDYKYMDTELIGILETSVSPYLDLGHI